MLHHKLVSLSDNSLSSKRQKLCDRVPVGTVFLQSIGHPLRLAVPNDLTLFEAYAKLELHQLERISQYLEARFDHGNPVSKIVEIGSGLGATLHVLANYLGRTKPAWDFDFFAVDMQSDAHVYPGRDSEPFVLTNFMDATEITHAGSETLFLCVYPYVVIPESERHFVMRVRENNPGCDLFLLHAPVNYTATDAGFREPRIVDLSQELIHAKIQDFITYCTNILRSPFSIESGVSLYHEVHEFRRETLLMTLYLAPSYVLALSTGARVTPVSEARLEQRNSFYKDVESTLNDLANRALCEGRCDG